MEEKRTIEKKIFQKRLEAFQEKLLLFFHRMEIKSQSRTTILFKNNCTGCFAKTQNEEFPTKKPKGLKKFLLSSECVIFLRSKEICNEVDVGRRRLLFSVEKPTYMPLFTYSGLLWPWLRATKNNYHSNVRVSKKKN